ncbi:hypothetical protein H4219_005549 [Mycoemilia scoparia]|uniref:Polymerase/histidinol phosphatase N-terminal domain-containing protein n=1 Tax=Mycoemilia scoparia TaxID=417184 RepID=A0A9W8DPA7_9FUNG|nr:hypothetical protein H4219_005549 [Mycoemilia scoparia]
MDNNKDNSRKLIGKKKDLDNDPIVSYEYGSLPSSSSSPFYDHPNKETIRTRNSLATGHYDDTTNDTNSSNTTTTVTSIQDKNMIKEKEQYLGWFSNKPRNPQTPSPLSSPNPKRKGHELFCQMIKNMIAITTTTTSNNTIKKLGFEFIKILGITLLVFLVLFLIMIPVSTQMTKDSTDYSKAQFNWTTDPRSYLTPMDPDFGNYNILLDAHSHTTYSDGKMTPEQLVEYSRANGYNALIVTDHQTVSGGLAAEKYALEKYPGEFIVIPGMEYRIHMNFIGINQTIPVHPAFPTDQDMREVIDKVHEMGGMVIVNHIPWSTKIELPWNIATLPDHPTRQTLMDMGVDGFEVINVSTFDLPTYQLLQRPENKNRFSMVTGSDVHSPDTAYAWTVLNAREFTKDAILDEIRNRRTSLLFDAAGLRQKANIPSNPQFYVMAPITMLSLYFASFYQTLRGMYSFQGSFCQPQRVEVYGSMFGFLVLWIVLFIVVGMGCAFVVGRVKCKIMEVVKKKKERKMRLSRSGSSNNEDDNGDDSLSVSPISSSTTHLINHSNNNL